MKAIVLAAGRSSRFWPLAQDGHKSTYHVGYGKSVIQYTLDSLMSVGIKEVAVVRAPIDPPLAKGLMNYQAQNGLKISSFCQAGATGTGDAILAAEEFFSDLKQSERFLVLNANQMGMNSMLSNFDNKYLYLSKHVGNILFGQKTEHPENFGVMRVDEKGKVLEVREKPKSFISPIRIVGVYLLNKTFLKELKNHSGEYSLEETLQVMVERGESFKAVVLPPEMPLFSLKYPWDLLAMNRYLMKHDSRLDDYMNNTEALKNDVLIKAGVQFSGEGIVVSRGVIIYENAVIKGPCFIDEGAVIGNHALIRGHSYIGKNVVVGAHSEVKNSILYDNVELHHNFIGDSILDHDCSLGAGTITANKRFDRKNIKIQVNNDGVDTGLNGLGVIMGPGVKTGINVSLMPGVKIGPGVIIRPGEIVDQSYVKKLDY